MSVVVKWARGGEARVVSIAAKEMILSSTVSAAPGSRLEGVVSGEAGPIALRLKVHRSKRMDSGGFILQGRPLDLTREARERLVAMISGA